MPRIKLTQLAAERVKPVNDKETIYWDSQCPGFGLRVSAKGRKTFIAMYRVKGGKEIMETIGSMALIPSVGDARDLARHSMIKARAGINPLEERRVAEAADAVQPLPFAELAERFLREHAERNTKPATACETRRILENRVYPCWGTRPACEIAKSDVNALLDEIGGKRLRSRKGISGGPLVEANAVLRCLKTLFRWAVGKDLIQIDPTAGVLKPLAREIERDRVRSDEEIQLFWRACEELGWPFGPLFKLLLLTGQRREEIGGMRWQEIDLDKAVWTIPAVRAKNGKPHDVALSPMAIEIIETLPNLGVLVFSTTGTTPVSGYSTAKARLDALMRAALHSQLSIGAQLFHAETHTIFVILTEPILSARYQAA